jgi:hypothetical protein
MFKKTLLLLAVFMLILIAGTANARWTSSITFEGDVKNDYETTIQVTEPTQDNIITVPDITATLTVDLAEVFDANTTAAASGANYRVNTGNSLENKIDGTLVVADAAVACDNEDTLTFVTGNTIGDYVKIVDDGSQWHIVHSRAETSAKLTCTAFD